MGLFWLSFDCGCRCDCHLAGCVCATQGGEVIGAFSLTLQLLPVTNDNFVDRTDFTGDTFRVLHTLNGASVEDNEPRSFSQADIDIDAR